ncbi:HAD-IIB family hydrolase [Thiohalocapsa marina]|uniref:HAD-IIB family hydrolase n=1 Tax=Thiohalocapsa marina TaxID=424902 RepID=A0A5M8FKA8_9GAMM|nr:HAD-IIB family hydrolase [Thiohalocapsa marina]KAA6185149.1 HAD-IIB family hydrolase [Thiohalocapsa marina]
MTDAHHRILICTDLDRTLLPNGSQPESPAARPRFAALAAHPEVCVAYVTGRHRALVQEAIEAYGIPVPDFLIGDVGTSIYRISDGDLQPWPDWGTHIAHSWAGQGPDSLARLLQGVDGLLLQEPQKQGPWKLSYYTAEDWERETLLPQIDERLRAEGIAASLIWSLDEHTGTGLLDVLPERASKHLAIEFLMQREGFAHAGTVCCGDSGNDLAMLTGPLQAVLVANATTDVRADAQALADAAGLSHLLYQAQGDFHDMNGYYAAGILEGVAHYLPETVDWWRAI